MGAGQRQTGAMRPGDFFSETEWPEGDSKDLYLYIVFSKGDSASTVGKGVMIDDVFVGRRAVETLAEYTHDVNTCSIAGEACPGGGATASYLGKTSTVRSYQDGRLVAERSLVHDGLNGRLSGEQMKIDWTGVGEFDEFVMRHAYQEHGLASELSAPYVPFSEATRRYLSFYKRGLLDGLIESSMGRFLEPGIGAVLYSPAGGVSRLWFSNTASTTINSDIRSRPASITATGPNVGAQDLTTSGWRWA